MNRIRVFRFPSVGDNDLTTIEQDVFI